jgi:hypothetical protein
VRDMHDLQSISEKVASNEKVFAFISITMIIVMAATTIEPC